MEHINEQIFLWINAPAHPPQWADWLSFFLAQWLIFAIPIYLVAGWALGDKRLRLSLLLAGVSGLIGISINSLIGNIWPHPRPFAIGIGRQLIEHAADASFPSDHLTLWWSVAFSLYIKRQTRSTGLVMATTGIGMAWARMYAGVHYPLDMVGALCVALLSTTLCSWLAHLYLRRFYVAIFSIYRFLFGSLIRHGWVKA